MRRTSASAGRRRLATARASGALGLNGAPGKRPKPVMRTVVTWLSVSRGVASEYADSGFLDVGFQHRMQAIASRQVHRKGELFFQEQLDADEIKCIETSALTVIDEQVDPALC